MMRKMLCVMVSLVLIIGIAEAKLMIVDQNGDWYEVAKAGKGYVPAGEPVYSTVKGDTVFIGGWTGETGYYFPNRGDGSMNMQWFVPPAECKVLKIFMLWCSPGEVSAYLWQSPFPYVPGQSTAEALDSIMTYWVYDSTGVGADPAGWVTLPTAYAGPMPFSSASTGDGVKKGTWLE